MRRCLLLAVLALVTVWATGCIIIDAEKAESRRPATVRSEECAVTQSPADNAPVLESGADVTLETTAQ
jgi:hypothetical protein